MFIRLTCSYLCIFKITYFFNVCVFASDFSEILDRTVLQIVRKNALASTPELIESFGYPCEIHKVTTEDGYILEMHRIPYGIKSNVNINRPAVIVQHGMLSSSADWVYTGPQHSLALILADAGYDVWLGNNRGNIYSMSHQTLDPSQPSFWNFSWHEMGVWDLPAMIDHVLNTTGRQQLFYIGHSEGNTIYYVGMSIRPEYNNKVKLMTSLAPAAFMTHLQSPPFRNMAKSLTNPEKNEMVNDEGFRKFTPNNKLLALIAELLCNENVPTRYTCAYLISIITGFNLENINFTLIPVLLGHYPSSFSTKQLIHYLQEINSGHFRQYDHGPKINLQIYGTDSPPDYDLRKITSKIILFYAKNDWIVSEIDVMNLYKKLPNAELYVISDPKFNHYDYVFGINAAQILYNVIIEKLSLS